MNEHVSYEYTMMTEVGRMWKNPSGGINGQIFNNMCNMVVYLTAQNLIWHMSDVVDIPDDIQEILNKVDSQIITLRPADREDDMSEKLQPSDFEKLQAFIETNKDKLGSSSAGSNAGL